MADNNKEEPNHSIKNDHALASDVMDAYLVDTSYTVHFVLFANGEPFVTTQQMIIESIPKYFSGKYRVHKYDLELIKNRVWFSEISHLIGKRELIRRDGTFNAWKPYICYEVYRKMKPKDILYYVDCSRHHIKGFEYPLDSLFYYIQTERLLKGGIAGSVTRYVKNSTRSNRGLACAGDPELYKKLELSFNKYINAQHVLNSNFILTRNPVNCCFLQEWMELCATDLITRNHTIDQAIFSLLAIKYELSCFTVDNTLFENTVKLEFHEGLKDHNLIPKVFSKIGTNRIKQFIKTF